MPAIVLIRGAGDLATGVALRLHHAGVKVIMTELAAPLAVRRSVAFANAVYEGAASVEGVEAHRVENPLDVSKVHAIIAAGQIPVLVDPDCNAARLFHPLVIIDGRMTKRPPEYFAQDALLYIGLGPGFLPNINCHVVVETERGHTLGRAIWDGAPLADTSRPQGDVRRILRAPSDGVLRSNARIGEHFEPGQILAFVDDHEIAAPFAGILRGLLHPGVTAHKGMKIGDLDARNDIRLCELVSDKSLAVGGGVLEAILNRPEVRTRLWD